jgi:hypothetical protein
VPTIGVYHRGLSVQADLAALEVVVMAFLCRDDHFHPPLNFDPFFGRQHLKDILNSLNFIRSLFKQQIEMILFLFLLLFFKDQMVRFIALFAYIVPLFSQSKHMQLICLKAL